MVLSVFPHDAQLANDKSESFSKLLNLPFTLLIAPVTVPSPIDEISVFPKNVINVLMFFIARLTLPIIPPSFSPVVGCASSVGSLNVTVVLEESPVFFR